MAREINIERKLYDEMHKAGGWRERVVLEMFRDGVANITYEENGLVFNYPTEIEYQDANGAMFDLETRRWVG